MRKIFVSLTFTFLVVAAMATTCEVPLLQNVYGRKAVTSLNGEWKYIIDQQEMGYYGYRRDPIPWGFFNDKKATNPSDLVEYDFDMARRMDIPGDWNTADSQLFFYEGNVWLRKTFNFQPKKDKRVLLYFGAVNYHSIVFINGKEAGQHTGGFTPFNFDITHLLKDGKNSLVVKADNKRHIDNVPTQVFDWWNYGGITRDVMLVEVGETYLADYSIRLTKGNSRSIDVAVQLNDGKAGETVTMAIPELKVSATLTTDALGRASAAIKARPELWSPESPKLYEVVLVHRGDTTRDEIGFRTIEAKGRQILLNGKPVFLKGACMHDETPFRQGRIRNAEEARTLLQWAKQMGCNFLRLAHYPHNELTVREAERMGIMLWEEIPCYWAISWDNEQTYKNAETQLTEMISRDKNRAATVIWSVANETPHGDSRDRFLSRLIECVRRHDDSRLVSLAMEVLSAKDYVNRLKDNLHSLVDVVSFNQYVGWYRDVHDAPKMKWVIPYEKPIIVTEFGGGALANCHGPKEQRWTEEFQEELYRQNLAMLSKIEGLSGLAPWCLVDFRSPRRPLDGVQDYFNRKGLISEKGERKKAFYVLREYYKGI